MLHRKLLVAVLLSTLLFVVFSEAKPRTPDNRSSFVAKKLILYSSCKEIQANEINAPSGEYSIITSSGLILDRVYCEMGLNGGGYTFLHPFYLGRLTNAELQDMITDQTSFLMRLRKKDGTQPYGVLQQLDQYRAIPVKLSLNDHDSNYNPAANIAGLGAPYLYLGFLPTSVAANRNVQGLTVNGNPLTFHNCDANPNSYVALFANFNETTPTNYAYHHSFQFSDSLFAGHFPNPSARVIPPDYFLFLETHWGGCGTYTQTDGRPSARGVLGANIGFR
jgi:hypothetical protein